MQGELETVVNEASSSIESIQTVLLGNFGKDSPLKDPQVGAIVQDLLQLYLAIGGL